MSAPGTGGSVQNQVLRPGRTGPITHDSRGNEGPSRSRCGRRTAPTDWSAACARTTRMPPRRPRCRAVKGARERGTLVSAERVEAPARPSGQVAPPGRAGGRRQVLKQLPRYVSQPFPTPWTILTTPPIDSQESLCRRPAFSIRREAHGTLHWRGELWLQAELVAYALLMMLVQLERVSASSGRAGGAERRTSSRWPR